MTCLSRSGDHRQVGQRCELRIFPARHSSWWIAAAQAPRLRIQEIPGPTISRKRLMVDRVGIGHVVTGRDDEVPFAADHTLVEIDIERRPFVHDDYGIY